MEKLCISDEMTEERKIPKILGVPQLIGRFYWGKRERLMVESLEQNAIEGTGRTDPMPCTRHSTLHAFHFTSHFSFAQCRASSCGLRVWWG